MKDKLIIVNQITCTECGDRPFSAHVHDYTECKCGAAAVDGGHEYLKRTGTAWVDISIIVPEEVFNACVNQLEWCDETGRNNLGKVCAIFRALRDSKYLDKIIK